MAENEKRQAHAVETMLLHAIEIRFIGPGISQRRSHAFHSLAAEPLFHRPPQRAIVFYFFEAAASTAARHP